MVALAGSITALTALKTLDLSGNSMTDVGVQVLASSLDHHLQLQAAAHEEGLQAHGAESRLPCFMHLECLSFCRGSIGTKGIMALAHHLTGFVRLRQLFLGYNEVADRGAMSLALSLPHLVSLQHLGLGHTRVGDKGLEALAPSLTGLTALQILKLGGNFISYEGEQALASHLSVLDRLEQIDISNQHCWR